jgi:glycosyltransferase involved in cell wall biosynthesis
MRDQADFPANLVQRPIDRYRIIMVEGSLMGGYEIGFESALEMVTLLGSMQGQGIEKPLELVVVGRVSEDLRQRSASRIPAGLVWTGIVDSDHIPALDASAHILYSSDLNAACPNSVIEALACGTPVLGFDTGSLSEIVSAEAGQVVPYHGDPWQLDPPDIRPLVQGGVEILRKQEFYRTGARRRAEEAFGLDDMVDKYLNVLNIHLGC